MATIIKTKSDIFVKFLFGQESNEDLLIDFINSVFKDAGQPLVKNAKVQNPFNIKQCKDDKDSILDIKCETDTNEVINIEMQLIGSADYPKRALYYWAKCYGGQLNESEVYGLLKPVYSIHLLDFNLFQIDDNHNKQELLADDKMHHTFGIFETNNKELCFSKDFQMHIIEMPKLSEKIKNNESLISWIDFFKNIKEGDEMVYLADNQTIMQKAMNQFKIFTADKQMRDLYEAREKATKDRNSLHYSGYLEGEADGIKQGLAQGRAEGISQGLAQGSHDKAIETARKMLKFGESIEKISIFTDLSLEEIKKLK